MTRFGYTLMGEGHDPRTLVRNAVLAEQTGFEHAVFSDHYHPWLPSQDHSPFTWTVLGAAAQATERMQLATMVTCPIIRSKPPCRLVSELPNPVNFAAATETVTTEAMAE
jgi:alkanesulfonate monooxygenase SsuD/methylene tetrahydromethanopterin reductase-like flavin-dependent oxidoreductase (luciferase family)